MRALLPIALAASIVLTPLYGQAADGLSLKSVTVDLPTGDRMFEGAGADAANNNCLACHSASMVLNQPPLSREHWKVEVNKMSTAYKAPIDPRDVDAITDYLFAIKGAK